MNKIFILSYEPNKRQVPTNKIYSKDVEVSSITDLQQTVQFDHVGGLFRNNERGNENFLSANVLLMDVDNDDTENSSQWMTPERLADILSDVDFAIIYSKSNMMMKDRYSPRPRFHCYFPLSETVYNHARIRELKEMLMRLVPAFDKNAKDASRFFYGVENPKAEYFEGVVCIDEFITANGITAHDTTNHHTVAPHSENGHVDKPITQGNRNSEIFNIALNALREYGTDKAREIFDDACARCTPPLPLKECTRTWESAFKTAQIIEERTKERKKKNLTLSIIEQTLTDMNISLMFDVIRKEIRVSDLPDNELLPQSYHSQPEYIRRKVNAKILPLFLTSHFKNRNYRVSDGFITEAISAIADLHTYNPVLEEIISSTTWDGHNRIDDIFSVLGIYDDDAPETHMYRTFIRKWLHQAVALALNDDGSIGADFILILQGKQGLGKTNFFRALSVLPDLFGEGLVIDTANKDLLMQSTKIWIGEIGELDATMKKEQAALKSFLTAHSDTYRKPYARIAERVERRTCFAGTVNPDAVIRDTTGSRRYAIIHVDDIDKAFIYGRMTPQWTRQLWRQVYDTMYLPKPKGFYLTAAEQKFSERNNERYTVELEGETELRDTLIWTNDNMSIDEYAQTWKWITLTALKERIPSLKDARIKSPKLGHAVMKVISDFGLDVEDFKRYVHGHTEYRLPVWKQNE